MPNAELVVNVGVRQGEVRDGEVAQEKALEHGFVDDAADQLLVRANRIHPGPLDRRLDRLIVDPIEVDGPLAWSGGILLRLPERHQNETRRSILWHA